MAAKDFSELECQGGSVSPSLVLFITCCVLIQAPYVRCWRMNCSQPDTLSILDALRPAMNLSSVRPVMKLSTSTNVIVSFTLYGILGVDEKAQVFSTYIWQTFKWDNEFISWDPVQCGTESISLPRTKFWVPDVVINEFMDENTAPFVPYVVVDYTGRVRDAYPVRVVSSCNLNIYSFPFDIQNCTLTFNSYVHPVSDIRMVLGKTAEKILKRSKEVMTTMGEWELLDITSHKYQMGGTTDNPWDALSFNIVVRRRATLYVVNLLLPSCFLITVDLFSFLLPPQNVDRSSFKMTLILGYTVFLLIMNDLLPVTGNTIPLINVFFSVCLSLMVASLLETVFITNLLCGSSDFRPVPHWVYVFVIRFLGRLVCLPPKPREQDTVILNPAPQEVNACPLVVVESQTRVKAPGEKETKAGESSLEELRRLGRDLQAIRLQVDKHLTVSQSSEEWIQVGYIIDRLLFGSYIIFISVSFITIIGIWVSYYNVHSQ